MRKGFTLVELLIVMIIVTVLVTMAFPKFKIAMERGRGLEVIATAAAISEALNTEYVRNANTYGETATVPAYATITKGEGRYSYYVTGPDLDGNVTVNVTRLLTKNPYEIAFVNRGGETVERYCTGNQAYCKALGATGPRSVGGWNF